MQSFPSPSGNLRTRVLSLAMFCLVCLECLTAVAQCPGPGLQCPPLSDGSTGAVMNCRFKKIQADINTYIKSYMEIKPVDYETNPTRKYPLLIYFGGDGERFQAANSNTIELCPAIYWSMPSRINAGQFPNELVYNGQSYSFFVVMPFALPNPDPLHNPTNPHQWDPLDPGPMIDYVLQHYPGRIDVNRIYLTGMSHGTVDIMGWLTNSVDNAKRIAASFLTANCYSKDLVDFNQRVSTLAASNTHIWGISCSLDQICSPLSMQAYVNGINAQNPGHAIYTEWTDPPNITYCPGGYAGYHYAWNIGYSPDENRPPETGGKNPYEWMIQFSTNTVLPVTLKNWTARLDNEKVLLQWTTSNEFNTKNFVIQRATVNGDFLNILTVPAAIASSSDKKYAVVDNQPIKGTGLYRLVAYDQDGKSTIFETRRVSLADKWSGNVLIPNPVTDGQLSVYMKVDRPQQVTFRLVDLTGRVLQQQSKQVSTGRSQYFFGVSAVQKGVYLVQIIGEDFKTAEKVSIE